MKFLAILLIGQCVLASWSLPIEPVKASASTFSKKTPCEHLVKSSADASARIARGANVVAKSGVSPNGKVESIATGSRTPDDIPANSQVDGPRDSLPEGQSPPSAEICTPEGSNAAFPESRQGDSNLPPPTGTSDALQGQPGSSGSGSGIVPSPGHGNDHSDAKKTKIQKVDAKASMEKGIAVATASKRDVIQSLNAEANVAIAKGEHKNAVDGNIVQSVKAKGSKLGSASAESGNAENPGTVKTNVQSVKATADGTAVAKAKNNNAADTSVQDVSAEGGNVAIAHAESN